MRFLLISAAVALAGLTLPAAAQPLEAGRFAGTISAGQDFPVSGDVHSGAVSPIANLGPLNPALAGVSAELRIQSRSFDDIYGQADTYSLEGTYGLGNNREAFLTVSRTEASQGRVQVGGAFVPALATTLPVFGTFGDYASTGVEVGVRQYFGSQALRPYVAGRIGVAKTDSINATFDIPAAAISIKNAAFYDDSTVFAVGGDVGVSYSINSSVSIGAEVGVRYTSGLSDNDSALAGLGLSRINNEGDRLSIPVTVRARFAF